MPSVQNHTIYNINHQSIVYNFFNDNGKRPNDIFKSDGDENSEFVNKLPRTADDEFDEKPEEINPEQNDLKKVFKGIWITPMNVRRRKCFSMTSRN